MPPQNKPTFVKLKPRNPKPSESPKPEPTTEPISETTEVTETTEATETTLPTAPPNTSPTTPTNTTKNNTPAFFQAIGVISGEIDFVDERQTTITIGNEKYQLFYAKSTRKAFNALKKEIVTTGKPQQRLVVYPKVIHFPQKNKPHLIGFQLVRFSQIESQNSISKNLKDNEFQLRGLWQFIQVCRIPCISVMKNFSKERIDYIKKVDLAQKVRFLKSSHIPISWKDAPIKAFRYNPKAAKEQGHPLFVQIKAEFLPHRNTFTFLEQLAPPSENVPRFLKAFQKDKRTLQKRKSSR